MSEFGNCTACDEPIRWAITANDKYIPLDLQEPEDGNGNVELLDEIVVTDRGGLHRARVHGNSPQLELAVTAVDGARYVSHFVTCPDAERFRRRTKNAEVD